MKRLLLLAVVASVSAGCVSVDGLPDPHGTLAPAQRIVVAVYPSPGPWIVGSTDSKAESAAKITPLGFFIQNAEDAHTLSVSQNLQQYLPRPHLALAAQEALLKALRAARPADSVPTAVEAGIVEAQMADWNKSKDQLDWRQRYYSPDPDAPAPRDYARMLTLDDALILDVNISFGTDATDAGTLMPEMTAASRVYRGDTTRLLWQHEDIVSDPSSSSSTLTDYQVAPWTLTDSLQKLAPALGTAVAKSFLQAFTVMPSTAGVHFSTSSAAGGVAHGGAGGGMGGGLVSMAAFANLSTTTASVLPTAAAVAPSTGTPAAAAPAAVAAPASSTPTVSTSTASAPAAAPPVAVPAAAPATAPPAADASAPAVSVSTPSVSVSTPAASPPPAPH